VSPWAEAEGAAAEAERTAAAAGAAAEAADRACTKVGLDSAS